MSESYLGEIRMFGGNYAPEGWAMCNGQSLPIAGNDALYSLIGTTYGGDGQSTFGLPDLRGRLPLHQSGTYTIGNAGGAETVTLVQQNLPLHSHSLNASDDKADKDDPTGAYNARTTPTIFNAASPGLAAMNPLAIGGTGGSQPHDNLQPYLCVNFIISLSGIYPPQN